MITEEEIKDLNYLFEECKDIMEDGYATIKLSLVKKLFDYYRSYSRKDAKQRKKYESVLDEIREYIKEHNDYLEKAKEIYIGYGDELLKSTCIQLINNELVRSDNLLQILDKVKE